MIEFISRLPQGYQEVEYIESSGTQYIDTGFVVNKSDNYVLEIDGLFPSQAQAYQGCNGYMQFFVGSKYGISNESSISVGNRDTVRIAYANQTATLTVNGSQAESKSWASYSGANVKLGVLRMGDTNNGWFSGGTASGTIYGYKVWKDEVLVSDCIPCVRNSDNVAGVYDVIREQFITNVGSGVFAVGSNMGEIVITPGGVISFGAALRRRMMGKNSVSQWTLTVTPNSLYLTVSINGENLAKGTYVVDDGTVVHFEAKGAMSNTITLDGATVASAGDGNVAQYDLVMHANYTATSTYTGFVAKWEITTQGGGAPIGAPISELPLGTLIRIADSDGGAGDANYEIADINNFVSGGVVLVRKNIHSKSAFGSSTAYPGGTLDNKMTSIYNSLPEKLQSKIIDATFALEGSGSITRKVFALTYTMASSRANNGTTEGKALQHYTSNANRMKTYSGAAGSWWLSSRHSTSRSRYVAADGIASHNYPSKSFGVVPAFVIPSETPYNATPNTDGSYNLIL